MATSTSSIGSTSKRMRVTSVVTLATPSMNTKIVYSTLRSSLRCASPSLSLWSSILARPHPPSPAQHPPKIHPHFFFFFMRSAPARYLLDPGRLTCDLYTRGLPRGWVVCSLQRKPHQPHQPGEALATSLPGAKPTSRRRRRRRRRQQQDAPREEGGDPQRPADARAPLGCFRRRGRVFAGNAG